MSINTSLDQKVFKTGFFGDTDDVIEEGRNIRAARETTAATEEEEAQTLEPTIAKPFPTDKGQPLQENKFWGKLYVVTEAREVTMDELALLMQEAKVPTVIRGEIVKPKLKVSF